MLGYNCAKFHCPSLLVSELAGEDQNDTFSPQRYKKHLSPLTLNRQGFLQISMAVRGGGGERF